MEDLMTCWKVVCRIDDGEAFLTYATTETFTYKYIIDMYRRCQAKGWRLYIIQEPIEVLIPRSKYINNEE